MGIDAPNIDDISTESNKPQAAEVFEVATCDNPDFQAQFDELVCQSRERTGELLEDILSERHKEILINIYSQLGENNPVLKQAIENQTIRVFDVPERDLVALSIDGRNVDYLYDFEGNEYFDFKWRRDDGMRYRIMLEVFSDYNLIENENYILLHKNIKVETFSNEYFELIIKPVDFILKL